MILLRQLMKSSIILPQFRSISSKTSLVDLSVDNEGICTLTMQRKPANSLNGQLLQDLSKSLDEVAKNKYKGMILTSSLPTVFSAGLDLFELYKTDSSKVVSALWSSLQEVWIKLYGSDFITAAAVNGHAPAGGCLLSISCEYRVMVTGKYTMGLNETAVGINAPKWVMETMGQVISSRETELALTSSKMYKAEEGLKVGLIDEVAADKADAVQKCKQFIKKFDKIPSFARIATKQNLRGATLRRMIENRQQDLDQMVEYILSDRTQMIMESYVEKLKSKDK